MKALVLDTFANFQKTCSVSLLLHCFIPFFSFKELLNIFSNYFNSNYFNIFRVSLFDELPKLNTEVIDLNKLVSVYIDTLNNIALTKKKCIRGNHLPFMNKELSKEIMDRTRLRNNFLTNRSDENKKKYSK